MLPTSIQSEKGKSLTSALTPRLSYDSRDHFFNPTEGAKSGLSVKTAGLGVMYDSSSPTSAGAGIILYSRIQTGVAPMCCRWEVP